MASEQDAVNALLGSIETTDTITTTTTAQKPKKKAKKAKKIKKAKKAKEAKKASEEEKEKDLGDSFLESAGDGSLQIKEGYAYMFFTVSSMVPGGGE